MKIKELWISKNKNLEDITFRFNNKLTTLLVGLNGFGKSNLLESIVTIFRELDLAKNDEDLTTKTSKYFFDFRIEYSCKSNLINICAENSKLKIKVKPLDKDSEFEEITFSSFKKDKYNKYFPDFIIGYYSGENKRVKTLFQDHSNKRVDNLKKSKNSESVLGRMFFTEQNFGELIFFTLWVFKNTEKFGKRIKKLLQEFVDIDFSSTVQIDFCNPDFYKNYPNQNAEDLYANIQAEKENPFWGITGDVNKLLQILYNNHLEKSMPISFIDETHDESKNLNEFVQFPDLNFDSLINDLEDDFSSPVKFFDILQAADSIGIIHKIDTTIAKKGAAISHSFMELSEGEQQLLTTIGLLLLAGEFDTLFMFDEPDTHLNPQWQRAYAKLIRQFNLKDENSQVIVATHSPLIVQSAEEADLFLFKSKDDKIEIDYNVHRIHNWRIDQVLQSEYFGLKSARPPSLDNYMALREKILYKESIEKTVKEELKEFENEFGVLPTGETLTDLEALQLIHSIVRDSKDDKN